MKIDGFKLVTVSGGVTEKQLDYLYDNCFCVVSIPKDEDFGLVPVEANAHGKMCIGVAEGGMLETGWNANILIQNVTPCKITNEIKTIQWFNPKNFIKKCKKNAERFSSQRHYKQLRQALKCL